MADPKIPGRMIRRSIATDKGVARMTAEETAVFCMILPHLDSFGKLIGEPAYIKEVALPFAPWATLKVIESALKATNKHTSVKWFKGKDGRRYLHAVQFERHQLLEKDKRGMDLLPSYPRKKSPTKSTTESTTESPTQSRLSRLRSRSGSGSEFKEEKKEEFKDADARPLALEGQAASSTNKGNGQGVGEDGNLSFVEGLSLLKRDALVYAITQTSYAGWGSLEITQHLEGAGFQGRELEQALGMVPTKATQ